MIAEGLRAFPDALVLLATVIATVATLRQGLKGRRLTVGLLWLAAAMTDLVLIPPKLTQSSATVTVITPHAVSTGINVSDFRKTFVALPGADVPARIERVPDLATALRHYPSALQLEVLGDGLPQRDRDAVGKLGLRFNPAAPYGLLDLQLPKDVHVGTEWFVTGRVAAAGTRAELRDPSGAIVDTETADLAGRFRVGGAARAAGPATFLLNLYGDHQDLIDSISIPVAAIGGAPLRAILRVGAPDPEFKYWRRWASDAGMSVGLAAGLSEGVVLRDGQTELTAASLANMDLVVLDERAWSALTDGEKTSIDEAVLGGLGLLLRADGPLAPSVAADWARLGFPTSPSDSHLVTLDRRFGLHQRSDFTAAPIAVVSTEVFPLLSDDNGKPLSWWVSRGHGRIGLWGLLDSYRLVLGGQSTRYGTLWSEVVGQLARVRGTAEIPPSFPEESWVDERMVICGLIPGAEIVVPGREPLPLVVDGETCAGYWPASTGWQQVQSGGERTPFYVRSALDAHTLLAALNGRETAARVQEGAERGSGGSSHAVAMPRWPLFLGWLIVVAGLWWRERSV